METSRMRLDRMLREILREKTGQENLYYQPPEGMRLRYPCILYKRSGPRTRQADDQVYSQLWQYTVTIVDRKPDSPVTEELAGWVNARYERFFVADNLYHDVFTITI